MVRRLAVLICLMLALTAAPALAGSGNGLYEPYPSAVASRAAEQFFNQLAVSVRPTQLRDGVFAAGLRAAPVGGPSRRAGLGLATPSLAPLVIIGVLAIAASALAARRRPLRAAR